MIVASIDQLNGTALWKNVLSGDKIYVTSFTTPKRSESSARAPINRGIDKIIYIGNARENLRFPPMYSFTYDLWNDLVDNVIEAHAPLFEAMRQTADKIPLSGPLVEELKLQGVKEIGEDPWRFLLKIELYGDDIEGFMISLLAAEELEVLELMKAEVAMVHGVSLEDINGFEADHGLDLNEEIITGIEESYGITTEIAENGILFELVIFDSEDIDNSHRGNHAWGNVDAS
jgi:hypothetical protein